MAVTIDQIKQLRDSTFVSLALCKTALEQSDGDMEKALEYLKKQGALKAAKAQDRATNEGVIAIEIAGSKASYVKLACETDFVARNEDFRNLAQNLAKKVLNGATKESLTDEVNEQIVKMGENIQLVEAANIEGDKIGAYVHSTGKLAGIVVTDNATDEVMKDLSMQIVAQSPQFINPEDVSADSVEKEKVIWKEQLEKEGKPAEIAEKIMLGKEKKFREENALLSQEFIKDPSKKVRDILGGAKVMKMYRIAL